MIPGTRTAIITGFATAAVLIGGFGTWAVFARLDGAVIAPGFVQVQENRQVVQHPDGGVVEEIFVKDGDFVEAGALLVRLDEFEIHSELVIVENQLFELMARRGRLEAERDDRPDVAFPPELLTEAATRAEIPPLMTGQVSLFEARRETLNQEIGQIDERQAQVASQVDGIDVQLKALETQRGLIARELDLQQQLLEQGLTQLSKVLALQREEARLEGEVGDLTAQRAQAESRRAEYALEVLRLTKTRREDAITELRDSGPQELELVERRRALVQRLSRLDIRAPVAGVVLDLAITARRAVLKPAEPLLYLVPQDRPLRVVAQVANADVDNVRTGQDVQLVFSAFPARTTPQLPGHVLTVSADALQDQQTGQHFYRVEIAPDFDRASGMDTLPLVPGMPVETFIRTGERSPLSYLLQPLTVYFSKALRET
ncbi:HlyD family type I secretion periplasmic adaptor subunit [Falsirhodobacter sp. 20TX0035]|uniref:HlyD family type I secretion periplasmic adaptor subunit n=1 Tax=Falsirhodobacter sp. 20TX0035 TaxID=3022019 RepID=UPI00232DA774|nr:HlyD family type I secretion periplasmic adaptor subunit [Falsirhodobacter sp. 20TX0035]MDB6454045.1 HlyD family type I secretion periplasmic adaptor subunit [Falsirhodobacter sp. 20TX0035]